MNQISFFREKAGIHQTALADALGWSQGRMSNYETKRRQPSLSDSRSIVAALNRLGARCTLDEVFPPAEAELIGADRRVAERRTTERRAAERRVTERAA